MREYSRGDRIGVLRGDNLSNRKEQKNFEKFLGRSMDTRYVKTFSQWKKQFIDLQKSSDMIILCSIRAVDFQGAQLIDFEKFLNTNTEVPTGTFDAFMSPCALITLSTIPEEQGEWAAGAAVEILKGKSPADIPIVVNKQASVYLNMKLAKKLGIIFPMDLIDRAHLVNPDLGDS